MTYACVSNLIPTITAITKASRPGKLSLALFRSLFVHMTGGRMVACTQPRRVAAMAVAAMTLMLCTDHFHCYSTCVSHHMTGGQMVACIPSSWV